MTNIYSHNYAKELDEQDELKVFRNEFYINPDKIYLDGNSLGLLSKQAEKAVYTIMEAWKSVAIDGWTQGNQPWFHLSEHIGEKMAPLVGANSDEVIATGSTTTNLHQLVASFYKPEESRTKILADALNFPSDIYALKSQLQLRGYDTKKHLVQVESDNGHVLKEEDIIAAMTEEVALIVLPSVLYRSGQILDMEKLTVEAHARGIMIGFDLCHSIGAIPHALHDWGVDFAFWCNYKHLNGGPGSVGGLFVHKKHFGEQPGLAGWFSSEKEKQFDMDHDLTPAPHAGAYQIGTPHVLSAAPLLGSLDLFEEAGITKIREKSVALTSYLLQLLDHELSGYGFIVRSPKLAKNRGAHVFIEHQEAARICKALKASGVVPDFRAPNGIRLAPVSLYNSFSDVWHTVQNLKKIMDEKTYKNYSNKRGVVA
ncbi:kynureninase [Aquibacillus koreensis]|uniref:Kynureninase n=1 Tax=Aquibacillus koreensis TaxID=279446 RepID=A0A9X3WHG2_9BACI|nr:kynureninase [Aquibacillus koreensis]MCT2535718.1 kynureninase [Aquibacillus koreensis]MDC3419997.1 kynureninase [Aquibacillus koreensis]